MLFRSRGHPLCYKLNQNRDINIVVINDKSFLNGSEIDDVLYYRILVRSSFSHVVRKDVQSVKSNISLNR